MAAKIYHISAYLTFGGREKKLFGGTKSSMGRQNKCHFFPFFRDSKIFVGAPNGYWLTLRHWLVAAITSSHQLVVRVDLCPRMAVVDPAVGERWVASCGASFAILTPYQAFHFQLGSEIIRIRLWETLSASLNFLSISTFLWLY